MTEKGKPMDRERFEHLLEAYGATFSRWPASERAAGAAYAAQHANEVAAAIAQASALDEALAGAKAEPTDIAALSARILAAAPKRRFDTRAVWALAACAVFGVLAGYGGGLLAPPSTQDDAYFAMAFEAPLPGEEG
jgi:hypothetical protein